MTKFFEQSVDLRSRKAMVGFLQNHFRYHTMNSWNAAASYANNVKFHQLGLTKAQVDKAYDILGADDSIWDDLQPIINAFTEQHGGRFTIGSNGRQGGYLVLYRSEYRFSDHKSFCCTCGQRNFMKVAVMPTDDAEAEIAKAILAGSRYWQDDVYLAQPAIHALVIPDDRKLAAIRRLRGELKDCTLDNKCGCCGAEGNRGRVNFHKPLRELAILPGQDIDQDDYYLPPEEWEMRKLRERVKLVQSFDRACDAIRDAFIELLDEREVVEEIVMVPTKRRSLMHVTAR